MAEHGRQAACDLLGVYGADPDRFVRRLKDMLAYYSVDCGCSARSVDRDPCAVRKCSCGGRCTNCGGRVFGIESAERAGVQVIWDSARDEVEL